MGSSACGVSADSYQFSSKKAPNRPCCRGGRNNAVGAAKTGNAGKRIENQ
jgi:hypothetical protein